MSDDYVSRNLCVELVGLTDWSEQAYWARSAYSGEWQIVPDLTYKRAEFHDEPGAGDFYDHTPAYSFSFVLSKVPLRTESIIDTFMLGRAHDNKRWAAVWKGIVCEELSPQDAVAKLLIRGINQGKIRP